MAVVGLLGLVGGQLPAAAWATYPSPVESAAAGPQPAFYTYQAPGGAPTAGQKVIALTFDDGPGPYTPQVLSVLERYSVPATFFEIGNQLVQYPQYAKALAQAGYPIEDHTWSHPDLTAISASQVSSQIDQTQAEIRSVTGRTPTCLRPPYNAWNATVLDQIAQHGLTTMSYSIDPRDWSLPGTQTIVARVVGAASPGAVVDLHDSGGDRAQTVAALPEIITQLRAEGYRFVSICGSAAPPTGWRSVEYPFGSAPAVSTSAHSNLPLVGATTDPAAPGYWLVASDGGVFALGAARFLGSTGAVHLARPVVGMAATPSGRGYWLVASDGGVFAFGDAHFYGSTGAVHLARPVVAMAAAPSGHGYWLLASDGGIFSYHASFYGSRGGQTGIDQFYAMAVTGGGTGYLLAGQHPG